MNLLFGLSQKWKPHKGEWRNPLYWDSIPNTKNFFIPPCEVSTLGTTRKVNSRFLHEKIIFLIQTFFRKNLCIPNISKITTSVSLAPVIRVRLNHLSNPPRNSRFLLHIRVNGPLITFAGVSNFLKSSRKLTYWKEKIICFLLIFFL